MLYKAGQEIDSYCTKCKLDLTHRIVAVAAGKPARVECRTCKGVHNYRAPRSAAAIAAEAAAPVGATKTSKPRASRTSKAAPEPEIPLTPPDHAHIHLYDMRQRFTVATWIQHKTFGVGVVTREAAPNKIEVRFEAGPKVLVHNTTP